MTPEAIRAAVVDGLRRVAPEADTDRLTDSQPIRDTLDLDSFDFLRFLVGLHETLGVEVPEADYGQLTTLGDVVRYLERRVASQG